MQLNLVKILMFSPTGLPGEPFYRASRQGSAAEWGVNSPTSFTTLDRCDRWEDRVSYIIENSSHDYGEVRI